MKTRMLCFAVISALMLLSIWPLLSGAAEPASKPSPDAQADAPWGKEIDGMVCRLIAPKEVALNEPLVLTLEVKNVSKRTRYLVNMTKFIQGEHYMNNECAELSYTGPDGKECRPGVHARYLVVPTDFKPIAPGEVARSSIKMLANMTYPGLASPAGRWTLKLALTSPKPARAVVANIGKVVGNTMVAEPVYGEPTKDQVDNAWVNTITAEATVRVNADAPKLTVHEWGVFCSFVDARYANANLKQEWASMPPEFYRQFPDRKLRKVVEWNPTAVVEKPIIYFYTDRQNLDVDVKVKFADGAPVVWWPCTAEPLDDFRVKAPGICRELHWSGKLKADGAEEVGAGFRIRDYTVKTPRDSWVNQARLDSAAWFFTDDASVRVQPAKPQPPADQFKQLREMFSYRNQSERFIYYDGLTPAVQCVTCDDAEPAVMGGGHPWPPPPDAAAKDGRRAIPGTVTIRNSAKFDIANIILVDHRDDKAARWARVDKLPAGTKLKVSLRIISTEWPWDADNLLGRDLRAAGLFDKEADSVRRIWGKGLFDRPGITALYLLPQAEYDRMLPLTVTPKPQSTVRVGIVLQGQIEMNSAKINARVKELIAKMDNDDFHVRDQAEKDLSDLGPAAFAAIRQALAGKISAEAKTRLEKILTRDASQYLGKNAD